MALIEIAQLLNCFMTGQPVPDDVVALSIQLSEVFDESEKAASQLTCLFARMCNLLASARNASSNGSADSADLLNKAMQLDDELKDWAANLPTSFQFSNVVPEPAAKPYSNTCHAYPSTFTAEVWILYRGA